jgi:hypothetical protein
MRTSGYDEYKPIPLSVVESKKNLFTHAGLNKVYELLVLSHQYFIERNFTALVQRTNDIRITDNLSNVEFSIFTLRGLAFEALQQWSDSENVWNDLSNHVKRYGQKMQLQLALLLNYERSGKIAEIFSPDSQFKNPELRKIVIKHAASPNLLKDILKNDTISSENKATALATLLYKLIIHADYQEAGRIIDTHPIEQFTNIDGLHKFNWQGQSAPEYVCPSLRNTLQNLAQNPQLPVSLNCLSDFFRNFETEIDPGYKPPIHHLGGTSDGFAGKTYSRLDYYLNVINNPASQGDAEAYALHRALYCFATSGTNHCGNQDIPQNQRRAWFQRLKSVYKNTVWAQNQKYYW